MNISKLDSAIENLKEAVDIGIKDLNLTSSEKADIGILIDIIENTINSMKNIMR